MAIVYETAAGTADQQAFLTALDAFAVANGWTEDEWSVGNKRLCIHKGTVYIQFRWDAVASTGCIAIYQSLGYTGGNAPGYHLNDSGNGQISVNPITSGRRLQVIGNGAFTNYYFFTDAASPYIHVVLEYAAGVFRHMTFGLINKIGDWVGGEYCSAFAWNLVTNPSVITYSGHYAMFDAYGLTTIWDTGTLHLEGMPNEGGTSKWALIANTTAGGANIDRASIARYVVQGGLREGPLNNVMCAMAANPNNGFVPMQPLWLAYRDRTTSPESHYLLGTIPDLRFINIKYLDPAEEFTVGAETWKVFPWIKKQNLGGTNVESKNMGLAYRKA
jgi:hypothetical protein